VASTVPDEYDFGEGLWRGDTDVTTHYFNDDPPDWEASTAYTVGNTTHEAGEVYVANTTCTYRGVPYTCTTAHTSGATFDATKWTEDEQALGPEMDISGCEFLAQYRTDRTTTGTLLAADTFEFATDGTDGILVRTLSADQAALLVPADGQTRVFWDLQFTFEDATVKTMLWGKPKILGDISREVTP
jgi:hypothetical protein